MSALDEQIRSATIRYLREGVERIRICLDRLTLEQIWYDHSTHLVSVGNLILHLQGNVSQYVLDGLGGQRFDRHRDREFTTKPNLTAGELSRSITATISGACSVIESLSAAELAQSRQIQGFDHTGTSILIHVVEHFSYHVGQISFAAKLLSDTDLGYYSGHDLNIR